MSLISSITAVAERILPGGETLVRAEGMTMLVENVVPGDSILVRPVGKRRGAMRGEVVQLLKASEKRVEAPCPVATECGGCALQFIAQADQRSLKSEWVSDAFRSLIQTDTIVTGVAAEAVGLRRRVRWVMGRSERGCVPGFYASASHQVIYHEQCVAVTPILNQLHDYLQQRDDLCAAEAVQAVELSDGIHVVIEGDAATLSGFPDQLAGIPLQWWWRHDQVARPLTRPVQVLHDALPAGSADVMLAVGPDDFVQGQQAGNRLLISLIQQWSGPVRRIADLFCGIGNLSLPLAVATGAVVCGAELNPASVRAATLNAKRLGVSGRFEQANLFEQFEMEPYIAADVLILDPPRRGAKRICSHIGQLMPKKIIMISCDPVAGARDGAMLQQHGYRLKRLQALDLFAYAGHVEAMSLWERA
ncbi:methyltransferase [Mariprofundus erugo]|uniref:class I SAM-dependent RNA methyltransferase n=1 Tax=Mariprofundus erugo TaxID=2528639 RepID=UPI0010FE0672|nr:methyltransferase [Mariprofundus erugo]TLS73610.1 methyltransferase [Mariprofundus erugo]